MNEATTDTMLAPQSSAAVAAQARELGEIQAGMVIALRNPRREAECFSRAVEACKRPKFAASCRYEFPRGGSMVSGPSVNLARELARIWGNIRYGFNVVDADDFYYTVEGWALDLEANTRVSTQARFKRLIWRKARGNQPAGEYEPNEREALELLNRNGAKCVRNALLQLFPSDLVEDAMGQVAATITGGAGVDRADQKRKLVHAYRSKYGIGQEQLEGRVGLPLANWSADDILELSGIFTALNEGHADRAEFFKKPENGEGQQTTGSVDDSKDTDPAAVDQLDALAADLKAKGDDAGADQVLEKLEETKQRLDAGEKLEDLAAEASQSDQTSVGAEAVMSDSFGPDDAGIQTLDSGMAIQPAVEVEPNAREYGCRECGVITVIPDGRETFECSGCGSANVITRDGDASA